jgi:2,3-dihydroxy-p-cumate/2,3-dihydroxybenzoate 3,4-dioxygenase
MVRYQRLGRVELNVAELKRSRDFYTDVVGLHPVGANADGSFSFRCGLDDCTVVLHESPAPGFRSMALALESDVGFEGLARVLGEHGVAYDVVSAAECAQRGVARAWRIAEPNMHAAIEFYLPLNGEPPAEFVSTVAKIQRIGHVVFCTPRYTESISFMQRVLGFLPSDDIEDIIAFMRPPPSPYHHGVGIGRGSRHGLHHVNFMVSEIDDLGLALNRFKRHGVPVVFGPGRHPASTSVFLYFLDPDGLTLEYSFGMEEFSEVAPRMARTLPPQPQSIDSWGGVRDPRMSAVGLVQPYEAGAGWQSETGAAA